MWREVLEGTCWRLLLVAVLSAAAIIWWFGKTYCGVWGCFLAQLAIRERKSVLTEGDSRDLLRKRRESLNVFGVARAESLSSGDTLNSSGFLG